MSAPSSTVIRTPGRLRAVLGWLIVAALVIGAALIAGRVAASNPAARGSLDPEGNNDAGALAIAEILRHQGIEITVTRTRAEVAAAADADTTLVMAAPYSLSDDAVLDLVAGATRAGANRVVFLSSSARMLRLLDLGTDATAFGDAPLTAECDLPELAKVGEVRPERLFQPANGVTGCFADADGNVGLLVKDSDGLRTSMIDGSNLFSNAYLAEDGNAALGLALLGQTAKIVWYVPSFSDSDIEGESIDSLGSLTPGWVTPAIILLLLAGVVVTISRGQRFGPLVAETLPVTVRASETMHGRARLTAKAADAAHAAESLRDGSIRRLARRLGLTAGAAGAEVADAAADRLRVPRGSLHDLLVGSLPTNDTELIDISRRLAAVEAAVDTAVHVERNTP